MRVLSVVGARPQFIKLAAISEAFSRTAHEHIIVHTGQHYDELMSGVFFTGLAIPSPDLHLGVGSGSHGRQTGAMLAGLDDVLEKSHPDWVLVYGDTNSTLAAALSAVKMHLPVAHLEAGLRSFNRRMPEEHNRVLTDHCSDLLLAPTALAAANLESEGLADRTVVVGDVMADMLLRARAMASKEIPDLPPGVSPDEPYVVATIHRAENTDDSDRLLDIVHALGAIPMPVVLLAHPRLRDRAASFGINLRQGSVVPTDPLAYNSMVCAVVHSSGVVTDSGGLQKETFLLNRPCTTLRTETEWVETLTGGWNVLLYNLENLAEVSVRPAPAVEGVMPYGDGHTAETVVRVLSQHQTRYVPPGQW